MNVIIIGFMGSGKTTIGQRLSKELKYEFIDTDDVIEKKLNMPIPKIFHCFGEYFFRRLERKILININQKKHFVMASGGGMPCFKDNIEIMKTKGLVIYLKVPKWRLSKIDKTNRPLFKKAKVLLNKRKYCYSKADVIIENYKIDATLQKIKQIVR